MRTARFVTTSIPRSPRFSPALILTAHGSADPRSSSTAFAIADQLRASRPDLDVRSAFCEQTTPNLRDVLAEVPDGAVVTPLLLASAHHARVDIPSTIEAAGSRVRQAEVLGEDVRLIAVMRERLAQAGVSPDDRTVGVVVVAVGSSSDIANTRTADVASALADGTDWAATTTAFATGPKPSVAAAVARLRRRGAARIVIAPWFLAHGRITDRVAAFASANGLTLSEPLGVHPLVVDTVLDRYDRAAAKREAA
jgi:sirohydrochlorin ferrochelatase